jgi:protein-tyrosine phosphatase
MIDLHCHILPGIDDGARSLEEAVEMAKIAEAEGIERIVATPHLFRQDLMHEDLGTIEKTRQLLTRNLEAANIQVEIFRGAEVYVSHNLMDEIRKNRDLLVINHNPYMFVEFPSNHVFSGVKELFFELMSEGITPIIAHPERNSVFASRTSFLYELVQLGGLVQANSGSFSGIYGRKVEQSVFCFLESRLVHFIASDGHNQRSLAPRLLEAKERAGEILGKEEAAALVKDNPKAVLEGKEIPYFPEAVKP